MEQKEVGEIILFLRNKKNIKQEVLCRGLCTKQMISRIEKGESIPDKLLLDTLLQRLGVFQNKLDTVLSMEEYAYYQEREQIQKAIGIKDFNKAQNLLDAYEEKMTDAKNPLQRQYLYKIKGIILSLEKKEKGDKEHTAAFYFQKAAEATCPDWQEENWKNQCFSEEELHLFLLLGNEKLKIGNVEEGIFLLRKVLHYVETFYEDKEEKVGIVSKASYFLVKYEISREHWEKAEALCAHSVELLRQTGTLFYLNELLKIWVICLEKTGKKKKAEKYQKQQMVLQEIYEEYGVLEYFECPIFLDMQQEFYLYSEIIAEERKFQKLTQEELAEGIYGYPESISRIENGSQMPSRNKMEQLFQKIGITRGKYQVYLATEDIRIHETQREIQGLMIRHEYERGYQVVKNLVRKLDKENLYHCQYALMMEGILGLKCGELTPEEAMEISREALAYTYPDFTKGIGRVPMGWEGYLINHMAIYYKCSNQRKKAIELLRKTVEMYEKSQVDVKYHFEIYIALIGNLAVYLADEGYGNEAIKICERGMWLSLECERGVGLVRFTAAKSDAWRAIDQEKSAKYMERGFYISDLMCNYIDRDTIKAAYEKEIDCDKKWY
ncbi:MAG: helix-turn-helix transcriptional regulator [Lachnospiraceae bacterium]